MAADALSRQYLALTGVAMFLSNSHVSCLTAAIVAALSGTAARAEPLRSFSGVEAVPDQKVKNEPMEVPPMRIEYGTMPRVPSSAASLARDELSLPLTRPGPPPMVVPDRIEPTAQVPPYRPTR